MPRQPRAGSAALRRGPAGSGVLRRISVTAAVAAVSLAAPARPAAAGIPELHLNWWVDDTLVASLTPGASSNGDGSYSFAGFAADPVTGATLGFDFMTAQGPLALVLSGGLAVENTMADPIDVVLEATLNLPFTGPTALSGSAAVGLTTDSGGGELATTSGAPLWQALVDDDPAAALFADPFSISHAGLGSSGESAGFGLGSPVPGPPGDEEIGLRIGFSLTGFDQASVTSVLSVVPAPGAAVLLAPALLPGRRRRR